ncbi:MAG: hypothetical protein K1060chlam2_00781 [Chlamydiae bacterium]|nr:hypothetical protein [Chlamydiota bacterium]
MKLPSSFKFEWDLKEMLQKRGVIFSFYLLCLLPFVLLIFSINKRVDRFDELSDQLSHMRLRIERRVALQKDQSAFFKKYGEADRYYLDHTLEAATFLKPEVDALELVNGHSAFESSDSVKKRLDFLTKGMNRLIFSEESRHSLNQIEELTLKQKRPVEVDSEDLKKLLSLVEGVTIGEYKAQELSPQLIIRRLTLLKKKVAGRETFLLEMQLIKREPAK